MFFFKDISLCFQWKSQLDFVFMGLCKLPTLNTKTENVLAVFSVCFICSLCPLLFVHLSLYRSDSRIDLSLLLRILQVDLSVKQLYIISLFIHEVYTSFPNTASGWVLARFLIPYVCPGETHQLCEEMVFPACCEGLCLVCRKPLFTSQHSCWT